jgi:3-O-methyltransferase
MALFGLDLYEPTRDVLQAIRPHLVKGGIVAFDELGHPR